MGALNTPSNDAELATLRERVAADPHSVTARLELGKACRLRALVAEAREQFEKVLELEPGNAEAHVHLAYVLLVMGEWARGLEHYEWRWKSAAVEPKRHSGKPEWKGEEITGKTLLVYQEQGLGDAIQFVRYLSRLEARGIKVVVECGAAAKDLLARCLKVSAVRAEGEALPAFDYQLPLTGLARVMGTTAETVSWEGAYVKADARKVESWGRRMREGTVAATGSVSPGKPGAIRVGLCWAGNQGHRQDGRRSVRLEQLLPLAKPGIEFFSLQFGLPATQVKQVPMPVIDLGAKLKTLDDAAAVMENLDLVITVDTSVAHLAGAMGKPVWVLIYMPPDWRWLMEGETTPWYPTMRLFRQCVPGEWAEVIEKMGAGLGELAKIRSLEGRS